MFPSSDSSLAPTIHQLDMMTQLYITKPPLHTSIPKPVELLKTYTCVSMLKKQYNDHIQVLLTTHHTASANDIHSETSHFKDF